MKKSTLRVFCAAVFAACIANAQSILPLPAPQASTVPANGDVNPYGVAFVPASVPTDGTLKHGSILVSNFNNAQNLQGTGTTIVQIDPAGHNSLFFSSGQSGLTGLTAALGILANGVVIAGYLPSTDGTSQTAQPGGLFVIDRHGNLLGKLNNPALINGPWGMAINDGGQGLAQLFVSNVLTGTIVRFDVGYDDDGESLKVIDTVTIGSGFMHTGDPAAFEVGNSGLAYDPAKDVLFVASHLHGPLDLVLLPNGDLLTANSDGRNADPNQPSELVEFTTAGKFVSQFSVDPNNGGAFGVSIHQVAPRTIRVAAVDDNQNILNMWTVVVH